jgi:hypothetical protein
MSGSAVTGRVLGMSVMLMAVLDPECATHMSMRADRSKGVQAVLTA